jgi:hypothetical protein
MNQLQTLYDGVNTKGYQSVATDDHAEFVESRFYAMSLAKNPIRDIWQGTESLYYVDDWEWIVNGEDFARPVRFTTLRDLIKALTDKFMQSPPEVVVRAMKKHQEDLVIGKKAYMQGCMDSPHEKRIRREVIQDMFFYGKGFRDYGFHNIKKDYRDGPIELFRGIATRRHDPRDVFVDENCRVLHDELRETGARDMIIRYNYPLTTFQKLFADPKFDIAGIQADSFMNTRGADYLATNGREITEKTMVNVVKVYEYMNQEEDIYSLTANGKTIFKGSLEECRGVTQLPVTEWSYEPRNDSFWGDTLASIVAGHIYLKDTLFNLEVMNLKLSLQPVLAVSGDFGYNPRTHIIQPGGVWTAGSAMNGKIGDSIQPLIAGNPNTSVYQMLGNINGELAIASRADIRTMEQVPGRTASEFLGQQDSMNAHNETIESTVEIQAEATGYKIMDQLMRSYMTVKGDEQNDNVLKVVIKNYKAHQDEGANPKFVSKSGYEDIFDLTDDIINGEVMITVQDKRADRVNKLEKMGRVAQGIPVVGNLAQLDPEALKTLNISGMIEQYIELLDLDPVRSFKKASQYEDQYELLKEEIILGNKVDMPLKETRRESMARLSFLASLKIYLGEDMRRDQKDAWEYHFSQTVGNITRNHMEDLNPEVDPLQAQQQQEQMAQTGAGQQAQVEDSGVTEGMDQGRVNINGNTMAGVSNIPAPDDAMGAQFNSVKPTP